MRRLNIQITECKYQDYARSVREKFINGLKDETTRAKIIKELTALQHPREVSSEQVLVWAQRVEAQKAQKVLVDKMRDTKEFDFIRRDRQNPGPKRQQKGSETRRNS